MKRKKKRSSIWQEFRRVAVLISAAAVVAAGLVGWFALRQPRSGRYLAKNVLLSPDLLLGAKQIHDIEPGTRLQRAWVFDRVEMVRGGKTVQLAPEAYERIYDRLSGLRSCREPTEDLELPFAQVGVVQLRLVLAPRGKYAAAFSPQEFQEVQFAPAGGLVRVQLPQQGRGWAYFRAPGVDQLLSWGRA